MQKIIQTLKEIIQTLCATPEEENTSNNNTAEPIAKLLKAHEGRCVFIHPNYILHPDKNQMSISSGEVESLYEDYT